VSVDDRLRDLEARARKSVEANSRDGCTVMPSHPSSVLVDLLSMLREGTRGDALHAALSRAEAAEAKLASLSSGVAGVPEEMSPVDGDGPWWRYCVAPYDNEKGSCTCVAMRIALDEERASRATAEDLCNALMATGLDAITAARAQGAAEEREKCVEELHVEARAKTLLGCHSEAAGLHHGADAIRARGAAASITATDDKIPKIPKDDTPPPCAACDGTGELEPWNVCPDCHGTGDGPAPAASGTEGARGEDVESRVEGEEGEGVVAGGVRAERAT